jgi:hypothetical protein
MASAQVEECTVASTRWPVSDALNVRRIVSGSRISRLLEARRVASHLALPDERAPRPERVFNRAFHRDDVPGLGEVDFLDQRRHRRGFSAAGRPADEDQAVRVFDELLEVGMQIELFNRGLKCAQQTDRQPDAARRLENIDPAAHAANRPRQVERAPLQKHRPLLLAEQTARKFLERARRDGFARDPQRAANAHRRRHSGFQMQVAGTAAGRRFNQ